MDKVHCWLCHKKAITIFSDISLSILTELTESIAEHRKQGSPQLIINQLEDIRTHIGHAHDLLNNEVV